MKYTTKLSPRVYELVVEEVIDYIHETVYDPFDEDRKFATELVDMIIKLIYAGQKLEMENEHYDPSNAKGTEASD